MCLAAAVCLQPLNAVVVQEEPGYGSLPVFELHSGFWINLHHTLYQEARLKRDGAASKPTGGSKDAGKPVLQVVPQAKVVLSVAEQRAWDEAVAYYQANYADKDLLFSTEMILLKNQLGDFETCDDLSGTKNKFCNAGLPPNLTHILELAAPVYRARHWAADDRANRAWIAHVAPLVREQGVGLSHRLADIYDTRWPSEKIRVDVSRFANWAGAYTTLDPLRVTISSTDPANQGTAALEVLFHEASHGIAQNVEDAIARECRQRDKPIPRDLWHALIFYTTGEVIRPVMEAHLELPKEDASPAAAGEGNPVTAATSRNGANTDNTSYIPYAQREGLYQRGWQQYRELLVRYWQPYLDGRATFSDAIAHIVSAL